MQKEAGERRDFLPSIVRAVADLDVRVVVEQVAGSAMGYTDADYLAASPALTIGSGDDALAQDVVLALRAREERLATMRRGAPLVSMLHFPTRPKRVARLLDLGLDAISLDLLTDDLGQRL